MPTGVSVVISGHSHRPVSEQRAGVLFFNPGSAGPRRFRLPISVGHLVITRTTETSARPSNGLTSYRHGPRVIGNLETLRVGA
jgi:hypothetical protein